jgi:hypothetical protein
MTRRVVIGVRANGQSGIFVSPPGIDAYTAADSQLTLNISDKIPQMVALGFVGSTQSVFLGLNFRPVVLITSLSNLAEAGIGYSQSGPARPSPLLNTDTQAWADIQAGGNYMDITCSRRTSYSVYNYAF